MRHESKSHHTAFTIMELLVVIIIITTVMGVVFPVIGAMMRDARRASAINTIGVSVAAARSYAMREISFAATLDGEGLSLDGYSGAAVIFTPYGELRLVENSEFATDGAGKSLELSDAGRNGYADIDGVDYMKLPRGYGAVGIMRNANDTSFAGLDFPGVLLLTPPFAIRFNEYGHIVVGRRSSAQDRLVFYDGDYDGRYEVDKFRSNRYEVEVWDPESPRYKPRPLENHPGFDPDARKNRLPFDQIDTAIGIILYSKSEMVKAEVNLDMSHIETPDGSFSWTNVNLDGLNWLMNNGQPIYFSRTSGTIIRENL